MALTDKLIAIGDAIREKNGTTEKIPLADMSQAILDIVNGGSVEYSDIVYNEDNSITLTEANGTVHTMECSYSEDGRLTSIKCDGKAIDLTYEGDVLVKVGATDVDLDNVPTELGAIETAIDNSGVLDSTEGTATEKVEQLIEKANDDNLFRLAWENAYYSNGVYLFYGYKGAKIPYFGTLAIKNTASMFYGASNIQSIDFYIDCPNSTTGQGMFYGTSSLKYIKGVNCSQMTTFRQMFSSSGVEVIEEPLNVPNVTNYTYAFNSVLKEIRFVSETIKVSLSFSSSTQLTAESIQSIIDGLNEEVTGQTVTLSKTAVNKAFETSEGALDGSISENSEWFNLIATKTNWTITLS